MDENEAGGIDAVEGEPRTVRRASFNAGEILDDPDDGRAAGRRLGFETSAKSQRETASRRAVARPPRRNLVQGAAAAAQHRIEAAVLAETLPREGGGALDASDFLAQKSQPLRFAAGRHR